MIRSLGTIILILLLIVVGRHDKKMKVGHKKIFDNAQQQMTEFSHLIRNTKIIRSKGAKK